jgi:hypothetical protein
MFLRILVRGLFVLAFFGFISCDNHEKDKVASQELKYYRDLVYDMHYLRNLAYRRIGSDFDENYKKVNTHDMTDTLVKSLVAWVEEFMIISGDYGGGLDPNTLYLMNDTSRILVVSAIKDNKYFIERLKGIQDSIRHFGDWSFKDGRSLQKEGLSLLKDILYYLEKAENGQDPLGHFHYRMLVFGTEAYYWGNKVLCRRRASRDI